MAKKSKQSRKPLLRTFLKRLFGKKNWKYTALATVLLIAAVGTTMVLLTSAEAPDSATAEQQEFELLALINKDRQAAGLQAVRMQVQSRDYARFHAKDMRNQNNIWHDMPAYAAVLPAGYRGYAENVAFNSSVSSVHTALMNSPGHRTNIMNGSYNYIGIGIAQHADGRLFVSENFLEHPGSVDVVNPGPTTPPPPPPPPDTTPPTISLTVTPTTVAVGAPVTAAATVSDNVGIERVEFYLNGTRRVTNTAPPFTYVWNTNGALPGNYRLSARAYDKAGNSKLSNEVTVTVGSVTPTPTPPTPTPPPPTDTSKPTVSLSAPTAGASVNIGSTVNIAAAASDNVGVTKVEFYNGTTLLGSDTTSPYSYAWNTNGQTIGAKSLTAKAYDAAGNTQTSAAVNITLSAPGSSIPGDANGDNRVNALDLSILLSKDGQIYSPADFDKNGTIGAGDLAILLGKWTW